MQLIDEQVNHCLFGQGVVEELQEGIIWVRFTEQGLKKFPYPEAFARHLEVQDATLQKQLSALATQKLSVKATVEEERQQQELAQKQARVQDLVEQYQNKGRRKSSTVKKRA